MAAYGERLPRLTLKAGRRAGDKVGLGIGRSSLRSAGYHYPMGYPTGGVVTVTAKTRYIHPDHLGSTNVVIDENDNVVQTLDYYPYGSTRISSGTSTNERRKFIGQFVDDSTLSYLNARYYNGAQGQFTSEDSVFLGNPK